MLSNPFNTPTCVISWRKKEKKKEVWGCWLPHRKMKRGQSCSCTQQSSVLLSWDLNWQTPSSDQDVQHPLYFHGVFKFTSSCRGCIYKNALPSQNGYGWKEALEIIRSNTSAQAGPPSAGCPGTFLCFFKPMNVLRNKFRLGLTTYSSKKARISWYLSCIWPSTCILTALSSTWHSTWPPPSAVPLKPAFSSVSF